MKLSLDDTGLGVKGGLRIAEWLARRTVGKLVAEVDLSLNQFDASVFKALKNSRVQSVLVAENSTDLTSDGETGMDILRADNKAGNAAAALDQLLV